MSHPEDESHRALVIGIRFLGYRARTVEEVRMNLAKRGVSPEASEDAIERLKQMGYLDDAAYVREFVAMRTGSSPLSRNAIRHQLTAKGVDAELVSSALEDLDDNYDFESALELATKAWNRNEGAPREKRHRRALGALMRKGHSPTVAYQVLKLLAENDVDEYGHEGSRAGTTAGQEER